MTDHARAIPVLASLDLDQSKRFYTEKLGFSAERYGDYLIVKRDDMEMHFWLTDDRIHPENTSCYIRGGQVPALYEEYAKAGIGTDPIGGERLSDFEVRPWNMKEFYVWDCHGNLLKFGCAPEEI
ncbi:VOC family protein [Parvibaculum sp.]|uniref:bleomycin resistance protein n=1 Tax=Parvibaculum sp. TaxID=2024848 RepID=UPI000C96A1D3|nr:VOC family protein [Parvibaculum sp.]MAB14664.1 glyoxalase [Parvibaculum sp.]